MESKNDKDWEDVIESVLDFVGVNDEEWTGISNLEDEYKKREQTYEAFLNLLRKSGKDFDRLKEEFKQVKKSDNDKRVSKDNYYLNIAKQVATRSTCLRRQYGAVITNHDRIISTGYNGAPRGENNCSDLGVCEREKLNIPKGERYELCRAVHAEQNAIIHANYNDMLGATLYVVGIEVTDGSYANGDPCEICIKLIKNAGIKRIVTRCKDGSLSVKILN